MINNKLPFVVILLISILFISGCTKTQSSTSSSTGGTGVVIEDFSLDSKTSLEPGDTFTITLSLKNVGGVTAKGVYAELINYADLDFVGSNGYKVKLLQDLEPNDDDTISWDLKIPDNIQLSLTYKPYVRVCYIYSTTAYQDFAVIGNDYGEDLPSFSKGQSNSPVGIDFEIRNGNNYYKVDQDGNKLGSYVRVKVYNKYNGIVGNNINPDDTNYGRSGYVGEVYSVIPLMKYNNNIIIYPNKQATLSYFDGDVFDYAFGDIARKVNLRLLQGKEAYLKHSFDIKGFTQDEGLLSGRVTANATYRYCIQSNTINIPVQVIH